METYESYAHESTLEYLGRLREYTEVLWGEGIISDKPLASFGAFSCSMVAFKNGTSKMAWLISLMMVMMRFPRLWMI